MARPVPEQIAENRARQSELYGAPLGDRVHRLTAGLGISQARLARTLGLSPAMLSQLVSGRRAKIGDPTVLVRLRALDRCCASLPPRPDRRTVDVVLAEVAGLEWRWTGGGPDQRGQARARSAAEALRGVSDPARLAAAAAALNPSFPELAEVLWQAAARSRS